MSKGRRSEVVLNYAQDKHLCELVGSYPCLYDLNHPLHKDTSTRENIWVDIGSWLGLKPEACKNRWRNIRDTYRRNIRQRAKSKKWALHHHLDFLEKINHEAQSENRKEKIESKCNQYQIVKIENKDTNVDKYESEEENISIECDMVGPNEDPLITEESKTISTAGLNNEEEQESSSEEVRSSDVANENVGSKVKKLSKTKKKRKAVEMVETNQAEKKKLLTVKLENSERSEDETDLFFRSMAMTVKKFHPSILTEAKKKICNLVMDLELANAKLQSRDLH